MRSFSVLFICSIRYFSYKNMLHLFIFLATKNVYRRISISLFMIDHKCYLYSVQLQKYIMHFYAKHVRKLFVITFKDHNFKKTEELK